jgi:hypothetical protein
MGSAKVLAEKDGSHYRQDLVKAVMSRYSVLSRAEGRK